MNTHKILSFDKSFIVYKNDKLYDNLRSIVIMPNDNIVKSEIFSNINKQHNGISIQLLKECLEKNIAINHMLYVLSYLSFYNNSMSLINDEEFLKHCDYKWKGGQYNKSRFIDVTLDTAHNELKKISSYLEDINKCYVIIIDMTNIKLASGHKDMLLNINKLFYFLNVYPYIHIKVILKEYMYNLLNNSTRNVLEKYTLHI